MSGSSAAKNDVRLGTIRPVSRLRWVSDGASGAKIDTATERAECILDVNGRALRWRIWARGQDGRWHPEKDWRFPSGQMHAWRAQWMPSPGGAA